MDKHSRVLLLLCVFSVIYSLFFINIYQYPVLGDGRTYYAYGVNLYKGNGYSYQESPPFVRSNLREPAYPFFIYILFKVFGVSKSAVQVSQAFLNGLIVLAVYILTKIISNEKRVALTAAFFTAVSPALAGYPALIASETLAALCLVLVTLSFLALLREKKGVRAIWFSVLTGLFCGCLALIKMTYFLLLPLICIFAFIMQPEKSIRYKAALAMVIVFTATILPWLSFNKKAYGNPFFLTNRGGITLAIKAERLKWTPKEITASFIYAFSEKLLQGYSPEVYKKVSAEYVEKQVFDKYASLIKSGYSEMAADSQLRSDALNNIRKHPLKYILLSLSDFHYMLYFEGMPLSQFTYFFKGGVRAAINGLFKVYSLLIIFFAVKGALMMFRGKENTALKTALLLPVLYTFFIYSAIFGLPRFTLPVIPLIYILASVSISKMILKNTAL